MRRRPDLTGSLWWLSLSLSLPLLTHSLVDCLLTDLHLLLVSASTPYGRVVGVLSHSFTAHLVAVLWALSHSLLTISSVSNVSLKSLIDSLRMCVFHFLFCNSLLISSFVFYLPFFFFENLKFLPLCSCSPLSASWMELTLWGICVLMSQF